MSDLVSNLGALDLDPKKKEDGEYDEEDEEEKGCCKPTPAVIQRPAPV